MPLIVIEQYNPHWPTEFEAIKAHLQQTLGDLAVQIDHIGSTSVPGLGAKDIIDIQISVIELVDEIVEKMQAAGYVLKPHLADHVPPGENPNPDLWRKRVFCERPGDRRANIHVRVKGNPNQTYALRFRDYLQAHPDSVRTLQLIKEQLARYHGDDLEAYYDIKDPVYDLIWDAAKASKE